MPVETQNEKHVAGPSLVAQQFSARKGRLRILHVLSCLGIGGTENGVLKIIRGLGNEEFEHCLCAVRGCLRGFDAEKLFQVPVYIAGRLEPGFQFPLFRLVRIMLEYRPDIVHTRNFGALEAIAAARLAGVPIAIHSEHGYEIETIAGLPFRRRVMCRSLYSLVDAVFTVTADLRAYHARQAWLPSARLRVIYNGVDTERFAPRFEAAGRVRARLGIPRDRFVVGTVGRLVPIKDHSTILKAVQQLVSCGVNVHALIVGDGPELSRLQEQVSRSAEFQGRVTFTGASDDVAVMLNAMNAFVLASISEGMSNTILEAMASGLPVLATRIGGNSELIEDMQSGWLYGVGDVGALTRYLERLAGNIELCLRMGGAARRRVVQRFGLDRMVHCYRDLYLELADQRGLLARS